LGNPTPIGTGEANTASNVGLQGTGLFKTKVGLDLQFKNIAPDTRQITVVDNPSKNSVDIGFSPGFKASCLAGDTTLSPVYVTGAGVAGTPDVTAADISDRTKMPVSGLIASKSNPTTCVVQRNGILAGFTGLTIGATVFASPTLGGVTQTMPSAAGNHVQKIGTATTTTEILIDIYPPIILS